MKRHISEMTEAEMVMLQEAVRKAANLFVQVYRIGPLCELDAFDFYEALDEAIEGQWRRAKGEMPPAA